MYSFAVNIVPDGFNIPLVGFVNIASGSHKSAQIGFINLNQGNFAGTQLSFINLTGGLVKGVQAGFLNTCGDSLSGVQLSFLNSVTNNVNGAQIGFINAASGSLKGIQAGFINETKRQIKGAQLGFINNADRNVNGVQIGFVNNSDDNLDGTQIGFVNRTKALTGLQLGFVNLADQVEKGIPFGFLSFVKKGGYRAVEISVSEMHPATLSFKTGVKALYTSVMASYNPRLKTDFAIGIGLGSHIPFSKSVYFNPELSVQSEIRNRYQQIVSLVTSLGVCLTPGIQFAVGPSVVWNHADNPDDLIDPLFSVYRYEIDNKNNLIVGLRAALRYNFTKW